jgi:hypothetical protein
LQFLFFLFFILCIFGFTLYILHKVYKAENLPKIKKIFLIIFAISVFSIYFSGWNYFSNQVAKHCGHGNCKHGWYSKYNGKQKLNALIYIFIASGVVSVIYFYLNDEINKKS